MAQLMITASELLELSGAHDGICLGIPREKGAKGYLRQEKIASKWLWGL
jgi:hypothetical protein